MTDRIPRPHRFHPDQVAAREVRRYQKSSKKIIPHEQFRKLVREIVQDTRPEFRGICGEAVDALQYASEDYVSTLFRLMNDRANQDNRVTILHEDLRPAIRSELQDKIRRESEFKTTRKEIEHEYRQQVYFLPKLAKWEWDTSLHEDESE